MKAGWIALPLFYLYATVAHVNLPFNDIFPVASFQFLSNKNSNGFQRVIAGSLKLKPLNWSVPVADKIRLQKPLGIAFARMHLFGEHSATVRTNTSDVARFFVTHFGAVTPPPNSAIEVILCVVRPFDASIGVGMVPRFGTRTAIRRPEPGHFFGGCRWLMFETCRRGCIKTWRPLSVSATLRPILFRAHLQDRGRQGVVHVTVVNRVGVPVVIVVLPFREVKEQHLFLFQLFDSLFGQRLRGFRYKTVFFFTRPQNLADFERGLAYRPAGQQSRV